MKIDIKGLTALTREALELGSRDLTKKEERRLTAVLAGISAVKAGASLDEIDEQERNEKLVALGEKPVRRSIFLDAEQRAKARFMQNLLRINPKKELGSSRFHTVLQGIEYRTETEGNLTTAIGSFSGLGSFVPTDFYKDVFAALGEHDPLYDVNGPCTVLQSTNGHPLQIPVWDDINNLGAQVGEGADTTGDQVNLGNPNGVKLGVYSFRSPVHKVSMEADQDIEAAGGAYALFAQFMGDRLARTIGQKLVLGNGSSTVLGIIPALAAVNAPSVVAVGSNANDGISGNNGTNSLGTADFGNVYTKVNQAWRNRPSCGWLINDNTLAFLLTLVTKQGLPLCTWCDGEYRVLGKRVFISPSMPSIGNGNVPVIFGDLSQWVTKIVSDDMTRIQRLDETYIDQGLVGFRMFVRAGGVLAYQGDGSGLASPLAYIINHS